jgi:hypothetical protein
MGRVGMGLGLSVSVCLLAVGCGASRQSGSTPISTGFHSEPVEFLPGGMQTLARGRLSGTSGYSVRAERYRFQHRTYFNLAVNVQEPGGGSQGTNFTPEPAKSKPLSWSTEQGCSPSASMWTVLFGVLADRSDRAYAYTAHRRYRLRTAAIPPRFKAAGVAAYSGLPEQPIRMLVTTATGGTLMREGLEPAPKERCQPGTGIMILRKRSSGKKE